MDLELDRRVTSDIAVFRRRRAVFSFLSIFVVMSELTLAVALFLATLQDDLQSAVIASSVSALVVTFDIVLAIRERASCHHATLQTLLGIRAQMRKPESSLLWQEYHDVQAMKRINYVDSLLDSCCGVDIVPD